MHEIRHSGACTSEKVKHEFGLQKGIESKNADGSGSGNDKSRRKGEYRRFSKDIRFYKTGLKLEHRGKLSFIGGGNIA